VEVAGDYGYIADFDGGLFILRFTGEVGLPDLNISAEPLSFCSDCAEWVSPYLPNQVVPQVTVRNIGDASASNAVVEFFDGDPQNGGALIGSTALGTIPSWGEEEAGIVWTLTGNYQGTIYARVRCDETESDNVNNTTSSAVSIYYVDFRHDIDAFSFRNWRWNLEDFKNDLLQVLLTWHFCGLRPTQMFIVFLPVVSPLVEGGGHCYGMAATSYWYQKDPLLRPYEYASTYAIPGDDGPPPTGPTDHFVRSHIKHFQRSQLVHIFEVIMRLAYFSADKEYAKLLHHIKDLGEPAMLSVYPQPNHSVLAYKIIDTGQEKRVYLYDNNFPLNYMTSAPTAVFDTSDDSFLYSDGVHTWTKGFPETPYLRLPAHTCTVFRDLFFHIVNDLLNRALLEVFVGSPVEPLITDHYGRRIGYVDGSFVNEITGAEMTTVGEDKVFYVPNDLAYIVETTGTDTGELDLTFVIPRDTDRGLLVSYEDIPVTAGSHTQTNLSKTNEDWTMITDEGPRDPDAVEEYSSEYKIHLPLILKNY